MSKNVWIVVDCEADGRVPPVHSMVCFGAVVMEPGEARSFYGECAPISNTWVPEALAVTGFTREQHVRMPHPSITIPLFAAWIKKVCGDARPIGVSDNNSFDFGRWMSYYFEVYNAGVNPFGHSSRRIGDLYAGFRQDVTKSGQFRKFRKTKHDHTPVNDARGNVEALLEMKRQGLRFPE